MPQNHLCYRGGEYIINNLSQEKIYVLLAEGGKAPQLTDKLKSTGPLKFNIKPPQRPEVFHLSWRLIAII